jgi:hypothetical protein
MQQQTGHKNITMCVPSTDGQTDRQTVEYGEIGENGPTVCVERFGKVDGNFS